MKIRGASLIEMLVVLVIVGVLIGAFSTGGFGLLKGSAASKPRADGVGETIVGRTKAAGKDTVCRSNLNQVRQAIMIYRTNADDAPPSAIADLKLPKEFSSCPLGGEPYELNTENGEVKCPHLGHEKY